MKKQFKLTQPGITELKAEVEQLISERSEVADRIKTAREFGDLSENAEYSSARQDQDRAESRIAEIENILQNVEVIKAPKGDAKVQLGSTVSLKSDGGKTKRLRQAASSVHEQSVPQPGARRARLGAASAK